MGNRRKTVCIVIGIFFFLAAGPAFSIANDASRSNGNPILHLHLGGGIFGSDYVGGEFGVGFLNGLYLGLNAGVHFMNSYAGPDYEAIYSDYGPDWSLENEPFALGVQLGYDFLRFTTLNFVNKFILRLQGAYVVDLAKCYWEPLWTTDDYDYLELNHHQLSFTLRAEVYPLFFYLGAGAGININTVGIGMEGNAPVAFCFDALFGFGL